MSNPRIPEKLITRLISEAYLDEILGDLQEEYTTNLKKKGKTKAAIYYWISTIRFINTRTLKRNSTINNTAMIKSYFIIAIRNIARQKIYSMINIGGLAIGIACSILLGLNVHNELSYDRLHEKADYIVKAYIEYDTGNGNIGNVNVTPTALLPMMKQKFAEVETGVRLYYPAMFKPRIVSAGGDAFQEPGFCYADSSFFDMFSFALIEGDLATLLDQPNNVVLTQSSKIKYFGDKEAIGQTLLVNGKNFTITGIVEDVPRNSSIQFDFVASFSSYWQREPIWGSANFYTYILLNQPIEGKVLSSKIQTELKALGISDPAGNGYFGVKFTPLLDLHLHSEVDEGGGDIKNLYVFGSIALLILLIAIINYTNLTIARSFYRAKEVGLRKSLGADRSSVFYQLIGESFVTVSFSMLISILLVYFMLPLFTSVSGSSINMAVLLEPEIILSMVILYVLIALMAGIYPAMKLAGFKPVDILKGQYKGTQQGAFLRKTLIVVQFFITLSLVIGTIVINKQLDFINNKELGYNIDNTLVVPISKDILLKGDEFKNLVMQDANILSVSIVGETPPNIQGGYSIQLTDERSTGVVAMAIDESFIETTKIKILAGKSVSQADIVRTRESKQYAFMINELAAEMLGWQPTEAIGQEITMNGRVGEIKGVVRDFHFRALYEEVSPIVLFTETLGAYNFIMLRVKGDKIPQAISALGKAWLQIDEASPMSYSFLDQEFTALHINANQSKILLTAFSILAIFIASLGLFGIVSFSMVQRAKEIGLRKVLGASVTNVLVLANREFLVLIIVAFAIAVPTTYWLMNQWLSSFSYHIEIGIWPMILGFLLTIIIAVLTISFESIKAALLNPIIALRSE